MKIGKIFKISVSAILSLALIASIIVIPAVSAETTETALSNLVEGGDFESGTTLPTGFESIDHEYYKGPFEKYASVQGSDKPTGFTGNNLKLTWSGKKMETDFDGMNSGNENIFVFYTVKVPVEIGTTYDIGFNTYTAASGINMRFSYGTSKWDGTGWANYGIKVIDNKEIGTFATPYSTRVTATSNELWLLFGVKDARNDTTTDVSVYFDDITVTLATNLIKNGNFENGLTGWSASTADKFTVNTPEGYNITDNNSGNVLKVAGDSGWPYIVQENVKVEPNTTYILRFDYFVGSYFGGQYKVGTKTADLKSTNIYYYAEDNKNIVLKNWTTITKEITTAENQTTFAFGVAGSGGAIFIDNIQLCKKLTVTANAQEGGTVAGLPSTVVQGDSITLKATANKGYTVDGWYNGDKKVTDSAIYTFTAIEDADLTAKFTAAITHIADNGFEDETLNAGWQNANDILSVTTTQAYSGDQSLYIAPASAKSATYTFNVEPNTYYTVSEWVRLGTKSGAEAAIIKVTTTANTSTSLLDYANNNNIWLNASGQASSSAWKKQSNTFYSGDNTELVLVLYGTTKVEMYVDDIVIQKRFEITAATTEGGTVSGAPTSPVLEGASVTLTATPNAGYLFDGWYNGDTLVSTATPYTFTVAGNTALTAKFIADDGENLVVNGSFEGALVSGWNATKYPDFTSVNAADNGIAAIDGDRVLEITKAESWNWNFINQKVAVEKDKTYRVSFWVYKTATANNAMYKLGTSSNEKEYISDRYFNHGEYVNAGKWLYVSHIITSTDTTLKISLVSHTGTVYIDDIRVVETDSIGNLIENGDMSNAGKALNAWAVGNSSIFTHDAEADGYTGTGALKIEGSSSASFANVKYTLSVKANTDYVFRFYAKNSVAGKKSVYKILGADNKTYMFNNNQDAHTNGDGANGNGADWGKNEWRFNSGENTTLNLYFVEIDNVTYIDDIYFGEAIEATCASSNKALGTVSASKSYVGEDDEVTYTATATAGGKFLGWRVGDSETLIEGETYTYKGFDDITLTAVFEAALGNVNEDSAIDAADIAALRESILGSADYTQLGDMNANSANDIRDLVALYKAISK